MNSVLQVLHLEDDPGDFRLIADTLRDGGLEAKVHSAAGQQDFLAALERDDYDLMLADYKLAGFDGLEALQLWRARWPGRPFIFVTGAMGEELAVESLKQGATDYVLKGHLARLIPAIRRALAEVDARICRQLAEAARATAEQRYRLVGELVPFGVWASDLEGNPTYLSQLFLEMTGQTLAEHRRNWQQRLHAEEPQPTVEAWRECVRTESAWECEFHIQGQDGQLRTILARGLPVRNQAGKVTSYVGFNFDITERKQTEERLRQALEGVRVTNEELARFNRVAVGRELRMLELKKQLNELHARLGEPPRYRLESLDETKATSD